MPSKSKTREIFVVDKGGAFSTFFKKFTGEQEDYDFEGLSALRNLLSNEKARLLHLIKNKNPKSIYELAKMAGKDFKSVSENIKLLERFGLVEMISEKTGKRERFKPVLAAESLNISLKF